MSPDVTATRTKWLRWWWLRDRSVAGALMRGVAGRAPRRLLAARAMSRAPLGDITNEVGTQPAEDEEEELEW